MDIIDQLNSGKLHEAERKRRPDCVDCTGGIHATPERARFVSWFIKAAEKHGPLPERWPDDMRAEYAKRYAPSR